HAPTGHPGDLRHDRDVLAGDELVQVGELAPLDVATWIVAQEVTDRGEVELLDQEAPHPPAEDVGEAGAHGHVLGTNLRHHSTPDTRLLSRLPNRGRLAPHAARRPPPR